VTLSTNLIALSALLEPDASPILRAYKGWADCGFDAVSEPLPEVAAAYSALGLTPDQSFDKNRVLVDSRIGETATKLALLHRHHEWLPHCVLMGGDLGWPLPAQRGCVIEPDLVRARILWRLHPDTETRNASITAAGLTSACFDIITGSVPTDGAIGEDALAPPEMRHTSLRIYAPDYWLCRAVSLLRPRGVLALVIPSAVLDRPEPAVREWLAHRTETIRVWRLPVEALGQSVDLVVLRRK
jgi:hypothetical protein